MYADARMGVCRIGGGENKLCRNISQREKRERGRIVVHRLLILRSEFGCASQFNSSGVGIAASAVCVCVCVERGGKGLHRRGIR